MIALSRLTHILRCFSLALLTGLFAPTAPLRAQVAASQQIEVTTGPLPSAYGAPTSFSQSRFSPLTNAYVLPPGAIYASLIYEDDVVHFRNPDHHWTEEVEIGLPYRFNVAIENNIQRYDGDLQDASLSLEARYAFAN